MNEPLTGGERGVSILASLVIVAVLGGAALVADLNNLQSESQTAGAILAADVPLPKPRPAEAPTPEDAKKAEIKAKCDALVARTKAAGETKFRKERKEQKANDDCVAAIETTEPAYRSKGYKCVGKSAQVFMRDDGTLSINWQANANVPPGTCKTVACRPTWTPTNLLLIGNTAARCTAISLEEINKEKITESLEGEKSFLALRSVGGLGLGSDYLIPQTTLSKTDLDTLNAALGKDPNTTDTYIPLDSKGTGEFASPTYEKLKEIADDSPNKEAQDFSKEVTLNPNLADSRTISPGENHCDRVGCYAYPKDDAERRALEGKNTGWVCDAAASGSGIACFNPNVNAFKGGYQGPCPDGQAVDPATGKCPPPKRATTFPPQPPSPPGGGAGGGMPGGGGMPPGLGQMLSQALGQALGLGQQCAKTQQEYQQQQQQYQQQQQQYTYQQQQWYYQQQYSGSYSQTSPPSPPTPPPAPCLQQEQNCPASPPQPNPLGCQNGTWKPTYGGQNNACVTSWQCVPTGSTQLRAEISCQPKVADVGMTLAISYSCSAGTSEGSGFETNSAQSGTTTVTLSAPPGNTNTATYTLTCKDQNQTTKAECSVQVARPTIVLVANPEAVQRRKTSRLGWITSGMKSCVISSPDFADFTAQNTNNTSVNGVATTPALTRAATFVLHCETLGGATREQRITVNVI